MDVRSLPSSKRPQWRSRRRPLRAFVPRNPPSREYGDRFIPNWSSMDFDWPTTCWPNQAGIRRSQRQLIHQKSPDPLIQERAPRIKKRFLNGASPPRIKPLKRRQRHIPQKPEKILDAFDLIDDFYLNILDWESSNILSIALGNTVYLWSCSDGLTLELMMVDEEIGPVTGVTGHLKGGILPLDWTILTSSYGILTPTICWELWEGSMNLKGDLFVGTVIF